MPDQRAARVRRWLYLAAAGMAVFFAGYYLIWRIAAAKMDAAVAAWVEDQREAGLEVSHGRIAVAGFPFSLRVHMADPAIAAPGLWRWRGEALRIDARPYFFDHLGFAPQGDQTLWSAAYGEWRATADHVYLSFAGHKRRGWVFSFSIDHGTALRPSDGARLEIDAFDYALSARAPDITALNLSLRAEEFSADVAGEAFALSRLETELSLSHTQWLVPPDPAAQWRAAGGAFDVKAFNAEAEGAELSVAGTIRLDDSLQPAGLLRAEVKNPAGLAALLEDAGALSAEEAEAAAAHLTLMAVAGGGKIAAPVELKDGAVSIAGVKFAELPHINKNSDQP